MILKTIAQFVRLPAGFSAVSNIIAAYVIIKQGVIDTPELMLVISASLCLYFAGMGLNDCFDFYEDRALRSNRPLPSGALGLSQAWVISLGLLLVGCILAFLASIKTGFVSLVLCVLIVLYNSNILPAFFASVTMGLCRYFNWMLALVLEPLTIQSIILPLPLFLYVIGLTQLSNAETGKHSHSLLHTAVGLKIMALAVMIALILLYANQIAILLLILLAVTIYFAMVYQPVWSRQSPATVQTAVMKLVMGVMVIDIVLLLIFGHSIAAACVLPLLFSGRLLGRKLYVS